jgi:Cof subfamily protein (haloacid dehalogenase superfamily)
VLGVEESMTIRLVASDLDDTLLRGDLTVSERVIEAIHKARQRGVHFTFATGRMPASTRPYVKQIGIEVPIITYNGAMIQEAVSGDIIFRNVIPIETAREVVDWLLNQEIHLHVYRRDEVFVQKMNDWSREYARATRVPVEEANLAELLKREHEGVEKVLLFGSYEELEARGEEILERFQGKIRITRSKSHFLEIIHPEVNKGAALKALAERLDIKQEEVMAIGDNLNDIEMIRYAGLGVAIGNARKEVKEAANIVTGSNQEDGVAQAIEQYVLGI